MTKITPLLVLLMILGGCSGGPRDGTFVGNPNLSIRYVDNDQQVALGGHFEILDTLLKACEGDDDVHLGPSSFDFDGPVSYQQLQIPKGPHCGLFLVIDRLIIDFDDEGVEKSIVGQDFDFVVPGTFDAEDGDAFEIRLADERWLPALSAESGPGQTVVNTDVPALRAAFLDGLQNSSGIALAPPN